MKLLCVWRLMFGFFFGALLRPQSFSRSVNNLNFFYFIIVYLDWFRDIDYLIIRIDICFFLIFILLVFEVKSRLFTTLALSVFLCFIFHQNICKGR